jgi:hypothetical protein
MFIAALLMTDKIWWKLPKGPLLGEKIKMWNIFEMESFPF